MPKLGCDATEKKKILETVFKQAVCKCTVIVCTVLTAHHFTLYAYKVVADRLVKAGCCLNFSHFHNANNAR